MTRRPRLRVVSPPPAKPVVGPGRDVLPFPGTAPTHGAFIAHDIVSNLAAAGLGLAVILEPDRLCLVAARPEEDP